jgi:hypothetical protein
MVLQPALCCLWLGHNALLRFWVAVATVLVQGWAASMGKGGCPPLQGQRRVPACSVGSAAVGGGQAQAAQLGVRMTQHLSHLRQWQRVWSQMPRMHQQQVAGTLVQP